MADFFVLPNGPLLAGESWDATPLPDGKTLTQLSVEGKVIYVESLSLAPPEIVQVTDHVDTVRRQDIPGAALSKAANIRDVTKGAAERGTLRTLKFGDVVPMTDAERANVIASVTADLQERANTACDIERNKIFHPKYVRQSDLQALKAAYANIADGPSKVFLGLLAEVVLGRTWQSNGGYPG